MDNFDETFVLAFYNSFLKIELSWDKENMLILNTCSFQKRILFNWTCVLIYSKCVLEDGFKGRYVLKILWNLGRYTHDGDYYQELTVFRIATFFWMKPPARYNFLGVYKTFNITNSTNLDCQMC